LQFSRFSRASDVPPDLVRRSVTLAGEVKRTRIERRPGSHSGSVVVFVRHRPLLPIAPDFNKGRNESGLKVRLSAVDVPDKSSELALTHLRSSFALQPFVRFCLLKKENDKEGQALLSCVLYRRKVRRRLS